MANDTVKNVVAAKMAAVEAAQEEARRQEVRRAAIGYLERWHRTDLLLPQGVQGDPEACVFANALGGTWNGSTWRLSDNFPELGLPPEVQEFIQRFDNGEYPDLIKAAEEHMATFGLDGYATDG